jgi:hypothetical protein
VPSSSRRLNGVVRCPSPTSASRHRCRATPPLPLALGPTTSCGRVPHDCACPPTRRRPHHPRSHLRWLFRSPILLWPQEPRCYINEDASLPPARYPMVPHGWQVPHYYVNKEADAFWSELRSLSKSLSPPLVPLTTPGPSHHPWSLCRSELRSSSKSWRSQDAKLKAACDGLEIRPLDINPKCVPPRTIPCPYHHPPSLPQPQLCHTKYQPRVARSEAKGRRLDAPTACPWRQATRRREEAAAHHTTALPSLAG